MEEIEIFEEKFKALCLEYAHNNEMQFSDLTHRQAKKEMLNIVKDILKNWKAEL